MANLNIINTFSLTTQGVTLTGKQGEAADLAAEEYAHSITGTAYYTPGVIATATVRTLYDEDSNFPATFDYLYFWADQTVYLQLIAQATNVTFKVSAYLPFVLPGFGTLLAAANTTLITGGSEPALSVIDSIAVGNYSGNSANYILALFD